MALWKGSAATKAFYDNIGWQLEDNGVLGDWNRFVSPDGPVQRALDLERRRRIANLVTPGLEIIELACGANPAVFLASNCKSYTAVDFSPAGLEVAAQRLKEANRPFRTIEADITRLPLDDESFDIAYSAQAIYHIDRADGQADAFSEAMRVLRSGGRAIFVMANPFPVLDPYRTVRRALAMPPGVGAILDRLRSKPPLPYLPMPLGWMRKQLSKWGT
jgi:ubiquinone/menaquinone biosynthesis C-methylase UbiE